MCILFLYIAKTPPTGNTTTTHPYVKLIVASNRDEFYIRPTKKAQFWDSDPNILAGQDAEEGGTWLGISKSGKLSMLLNIMSATPAKKMKSRGGLVTGFLKSTPTLRGLTYCTNLHQDEDIRTKFRLFNFITVDLLSSTSMTNRPTPGSSTSEPHCSKQSSEVTYFTNVLESGPRILTGGDSQTYAFGNSVYESPFCKVSDGCQKFDTIIETFKDKPVSESMKNDLKQELLGFLKSSEKHFPDKQMETQSKETSVPPQLLPELSSIFVKSSKMNYGTRTHTIIVIDSTNHVDFHEWTLKEPIDIEHPQWIESKYEFEIPTI